MNISEIGLVLVIFNLIVDMIYRSLISKYYQAVIICHIDISPGYKYPV